MPKLKSVGCGKRLGLKEEWRAVAVAALGEDPAEKLRRIADRITSNGGSVSLQGRGRRCLLIAKLPRAAQLEEDEGTIVIACEIPEEG
jgi:hypothetical protein